MCDTMCFLSCLFFLESQQMPLCNAQTWGIPEGLGYCWIGNLGECWNLSNSGPLEVRWVECNCWEGNRERKKRLMYPLRICGWLCCGPLVLQSILACCCLLLGCCQNAVVTSLVNCMFMSFLILLSWRFGRLSESENKVSKTCHRSQSEAPLATAFGSAPC